MSYREALEAAGATVHEFKEFGSYQGDWFAKVTVDGALCWINGGYGSCSGCDAFESEFGYSESDKCEAHRYDERPQSCEACEAALLAYQKHLAAFGKTYVGTRMTQEQIEEYAKEAAGWSSEDADALAWLRANRIEEEKK